MHHPLRQFRPIVCCAGASFLSFLSRLIFLSFYVPFLCFSLSLFYFSFSSIPLPLPPLIFLVHTRFLSLASWWSLPRDLFALLATCALWLPLADVAHHRAQHALNKPSNLKTPQGTTLSAPYLFLTLSPPCGNPPPSSKPPQLFSATMLQLTDFGCYCFWMFSHLQNQMLLL